MKKNMKYLSLSALVSLTLSTPHTSHGMENAPKSPIDNRPFSVQQLSINVDLQEPIKQSIGDLNQKLEETAIKKIPRKVLEESLTKSNQELLQANMRVEDLKRQLEEEKSRPYQETQSFKDYFEHERRKKFNFSPEQTQAAKKAFAAMNMLPENTINYSQVVGILEDLLWLFPRSASLEQAGYDAEKYGYQGSSILCLAYGLNARSHKETGTLKEKYSDLHEYRAIKAYFQNLS